MSFPYSSVLSCPPSLSQGGSSPASPLTDVRSLATRAAGVAVLSGSSLFVAVPVSAQNMVVQIIQNQCSRAMNADFKAAGKTPPPGMVQDTCNCVAERIEKLDSIEEAKTFCVKQSTAKYGAVKSP